MAIEKKCGACEFAKLPKSGPQKCGPFGLSNRDGAMFDHFAQEHVQASGTDILFWHQNLKESIRDPLYDEPIDREWLGPYKLKAWVEYIAGSPQMQEQGMTVRWQGSLWIARKELEDGGIPAPLEGDVIKYWDNKFFTEHGVNAEIGEDGFVEGGYFFDVINVDDDGHVHDSDHFVGLTVTIMRRTEFTPERRLDG